VLVEIPEPFDFELSVERYRTFGPDPVNLAMDGAFHRFLEGSEVRLVPAPCGVAVSPADRALAVPVQRFLGAEFDLDGFSAFAATDPVLSPVVAGLRGFRPTLTPDPFEMLVSSITAQQVSLRAALAIRRRLVERYGGRGAVAWAFPSRERLAGASVEKLRALGFSTRKAEYTIALAGSELDLGGLAELADDEVAAHLVALPGIGEWTADWFLARHLGRPDAWPAGDLGLRKAIARFYLDGDDPSVAEARAFGERFGGHRNLAAQYLLLGLRVAP